MLKKYLRPIAVISVLVITITVFTIFFIHHPEIKKELQHISISELLLLLGLYSLSIVALAVVNAATLRLCDIKVKPTETILITAYSAVINFFGPLQSGPAARAVYLKKRYDLNLKRYGIATLMYYFFFSLYSGIFLLSGLLKWYLVPLVIIGLIVLYFLSKHRLVKDRLKEINLKSWYYIATATFFQLAIISIIYFVELHSIAPKTKLSQAVIYAGAANFALFVSITPGAIGFRESFLVFSKRLHHISNASIVSANIVDRSVYIVLLLILAVFIGITHAGRRLNLSKKTDK
jgi:uncharacterized membrane protein YbhN (UPF0104 family)